MKKVLKIVLVGCILCVVLALLVGVAGYYYYPSLGEAMKLRIQGAYKSMPLRISCTIPIPPEEGTLVFLRFGVHPSLGAYEYKLKITKGLTAVERSMPSGSSASILVNTYWYPADQQGGAWIRLQDQEGELLVDIRRQKVSRVLRHKGHIFAGNLSSGQEGTAMVESGGRIIISVGGREANEITGLSIANSPGTYIGRIEGNTYRLRFITPDQSPEKRIRVLE
jgi:hypothetical protein